jgi:F-type H+-transporting ATPase subunit delta
MTQIANAYAQGLYALAKDEALTEEILQQLQTLGEAFAQEPAFCRLLSMPNVGKAERLEIVDRSFRDKVHPYVLNFLKILTERGYAVHFFDCCKAYREFYNEDHGILPVRAVTALPLTEAQKTKLTEKLADITGKIVELTNKVDPACLGGVCLDYDGKRVDGTVKSRLDGMAAALKNTV